MNPNTLLKTSIIGSILLLICCATPVLVILLGAVGLSAWVAGLDAVLFPALAVVLALTAYALWKRKKAE